MTESEVEYYVIDVSRFAIAAFPLVSKVSEGISTFSDNRIR